MKTRFLAAAAIAVLSIGSHVAFAQQNLLPHPT